MHPLRRQRLLIVLFIVVAASLAVGLLGYALRQNINLFYPPSAIAAGEAPVGRDIRAGGMVLDGSVQRAPDSLAVSFIVTDYQANVPVRYTGILPDLFSEGEGIVVSGQLDEQGVFQASQVLAKHDENYMPPEVSDALERAQREN
ncbi:MAG: cytochrome c-type biogenesis protein CcmE [Bermanella sp.]|jgi:cytochrome c-type biogenesis protein CcmE